jgi:hypothetical protein
MTNKYLMSASVNAHGGSVLNPLKPAEGLTGWRLPGF